MNNKIDFLKEKINTLAIAHVVFDLDGTLYSSKAGMEFKIKPRMWSCLAEELNISVKKAHKLLWQCIQDYEDEAIGLQERFGIDPDKFYQTVYDGLDVSGVRLYEGLPDRLRQLSLKIPISLITNSNKTHAYRILKKLGLYEFFTSVFSFEDNNYVRKPDKRAFDALVEKLGISPKEILYFDDSMPNLWTAYKMGIFTVLVSNQLAEPPMFMEMHMRVRHEVPEFVDYATHDIVATLSEII